MWTLPARCFKAQSWGHNQVRCFRAQSWGHYQQDVLGLLRGLTQTRCSKAPWYRGHNEARCFRTPSGGHTQYTLHMQGKMFQVSSGVLPRLDVLRLHGTGIQYNQENSSSKTQHRIKFLLKKIIILDIFWGGGTCGITSALVSTPALYNTNGMSKYTLRPCNPPYICTLLLRTTHR